MLGFLGITVPHKNKNNSFSYHLNFNPTAIRLYSSNNSLNNKGRRQIIPRPKVNWLITKKRQFNRFVIRLTHEYKWFGYIWYTYIRPNLRIFYGYYYDITDLEHLKCTFNKKTICAYLEHKRRAFNIYIIEKAHTNKKFGYIWYTYIRPKLRIFYGYYYDITDLEHLKRTFNKKTICAYLERKRRTFNIYIIEKAHTNKKFGFVWYTYIIPKIRTFYGFYRSFSYENRKRHFTKENFLYNVNYSKNWWKQWLIIKLLDFQTNHPKIIEWFIQFIYELRRNIIYKVNKWIWRYVLVKEYLEPKLRTINWLFQKFLKKPILVIINWSYLFWKKQLNRKNITFNIYSNRQTWFQRLIKQFLYSAHTPIILLQQTTSKSFSKIIILLKQTTSNKLVNFFKNLFIVGVICLILIIIIILFM